MEVNNSVFWDVAYRNHAPTLLGVLRRYVRDVSIAQDLLHEVFITAIEKYEGYTGKGSFEGWLYRITVNTALMYLRNERNRQLPAEAVLSVMDDEDTDDEKADKVRATIEAAGFSGDELLAAIDRLPEHHKLVFNMYVMDDFSHRQIATELQISPGTSKSHLARARKKIQHFLYEDAMNRTKKRDRRRASAFLLLFPAKRHYIDRLYRDGLSDFKIPPTEFHHSKITSGDSFGVQGFKNSNIQNEHLELWNQKSRIMESGIMESFWGSKLSYMAACCGTAAITGTVCWMAMSDNSPLNTQKEMVIVSDTLMYSPSLSKPIEPDTTNFNLLTPFPINANPDHAYFHPSDSAPSNQQQLDSVPPSDEKTTAPVVVKKQIIQHQTVVVRDTVFIIE